MRVQRIRPSERFFVTPFFASMAPMLNREVRELMSAEVVATTPEATPYEVAQAMVQEGVEALPVVDRDLKLLGIVSEDDLLSQVNFPHGKILDGLRALFGRGDGRLEKSLARDVSELMSRDVCSVRATESLQTAAELMIERHVRVLPVVDAEGRVVGMLRRSQILRAMLQWSEHHPEE
jgi:CBS domain-containing protein